jgi:hypothetical protein
VARHAAAAALATALTDPQFTAAQLEAAVAAGSIQVLVGLMQAAKDTEEFVAATRALGTITLGQLRLAYGCAAP